MQPQTDNSSNPGPLVVDEDEDNFEEISESREIVEDRINRMKLSMIDYTVKQQELSEKMVQLHKDKELLSLKLDDSIGCQ